MAFTKGENPHRPRKGDSIRVEPIRSKRHIANIKKILADKPRDLCLFTLGINTICIKVSYVPHNHDVRPRERPPCRTHNPQVIGDSFGVFFFVYTTPSVELA